MRSIEALKEIDLDRSYDDDEIPSLIALWDASCSVEACQLVAESELMTAIATLSHSCHCFRLKVQFFFVLAHIACQEISLGIIANVSTCLSESSLSTSLSLFDTVAELFISCPDIRVAGESLRCAFLAFSDAFRYFLALMASIPARRVVVTFFLHDENAARLAALLASVRKSEFLLRCCDFVEALISVSAAAVKSMEEARIGAAAVEALHSQIKSREC